MASLRDIRKRIRSVKSSQKITNAMKLVAAAKLKKAHDAIVQARPYAHTLGLLLGRVAAKAAATNEAQQVHPLLELRPPSRVLLIVISSDRGLCGAFNTNLFRRAERFIYEYTELEARFSHLEIATIGKRARDYFNKRRIATVRDYPDLLSHLSFRRAIEIATEIVHEFNDKQLDAVYLLHNEFKSALSQRVAIHDILPIVQAELPQTGLLDYVYEPNQATILDQLIPEYIATQLWRGLLESVASEHGARMTAMDAASKNARDLTDDLTLQYNRARQATITRELMDIVGGAEALQS